jgi:hypothetical protein
MKKYWHKITVQHLEAIQTKTREFISKTKDRYNSTFHIFKWQEFTDAVPEILSAFDHLDMKVIMVSAYFMKNNTHGSPHKDSTVIPIRVNIPILNTANTWTTFWEPKPEYVDQGGIMLPNGLKYYPYNRDDLVEQTRCEITDATLIRPMEIHSVEFAEDNPTPRITLTLSLDPLPYNYFPDIENQISIQDLTSKEWGEESSHKREFFRSMVRPGYL